MLWNDAREAKSPNLGPGFFGRQQSVKFTEFLMLLVAAAFLLTPLYCQTVESWNKGVEECKCDVLPAFVQNTTMQIDESIGRGLIFVCK